MVLTKLLGHSTNCYQQIECKTVVRFELPGSSKFTTTF